MNKNGTYRVLIVDDDEMVRKLISTLLSKKGHLCEQARDGLDALAKSSQNEYDAVITDVVMPNMDGILLTRELLKKYPALPVMVMTGYSRSTYRKQTIDEAAFDEGASEFIDKPFSVQEFSVRFHKMMVNHKTLAQIKARQQEIERRSSQIITDLQKESAERIEALRKEVEALKGNPDK